MQVHEKDEVGTYYQFDGYTLDPTTRTLRHGQRLIALTPKVFKTLLALIENRDRVLTKDELLDIIWPGQFVEEANLSQNISVLRKSLGETESEKKYIATFPGRGYRFVDDVEIKQYSREDKPLTLPELEGSPLAKADVVFEALDSNLPSDGLKEIRSAWRSAGIVTLVVIAAVTLAGFAAYRSHSRAVTGDYVPAKVFARMNAALWQPSWSKDGKMIAFVAMDLSGAQSAVYVQSVGDVQPHSIASDAGRYSSPVWSPDGKSLAFFHFNLTTTEIVLFDTQRNAARVLTSLFAHRYALNYRHLDWSPDGRFLVVDDKNQDSEPLSLYLIYIDSGNRVRLTYPDMDIIGDVAPRVSPDGTSVAFIRVRYNFQQDIYTTDVRGGDTRRVTSSSTLISDVGWRTDRVLAFAANYGDGFNFWEADLKRPGQKETIASRVNSDRALQFSILQQGQKVVFSNYSPNLDIWSIDISKPSANWVPVIQAPGENLRPSISPDGRNLAFLSNVSGQMRIWVSHPDGTGASVVDTGDLDPATYCWSPDGESIVFSPTLLHGLYAVSLHGNTAVKQISAIYSDPSYAADGRSIFARTHFFIYRVPLQGGKAQEVTQQGGAPIAQSQNGRYLYFSQGRMTTAITRLDLQTGHQDIVVHSLLPGYAGSWVLNSQGIFFLGEEHDQPAIRFFNFTTGRESHVAGFTGELPPAGLSSLGVSPDGEHLWAIRANLLPAEIKTIAFQPAKD